MTDMIHEKEDGKNMKPEQRKIYMENLLPGHTLV
jgi:hypothetical protein